MISGIGSGEFPDYIDVLKVPFVSVSTSSGRCNATRVSEVLVVGLKNWGDKDSVNGLNLPIIEGVNMNLPGPASPLPLDRNRVNVSAK